MKSINILFSLFAAFLINVGLVNYVNAQCASSDLVQTPFNTNNGFDGIMFDVQASSNIVVNCMSTNVDAGTGNFRIYYKAGTHVGFENNAGAWTLAGTATNVTSAGTNNPTYIPININLNINNGQTYAFYVTTEGTPSYNYTDGTGVGNVLASDANITVREGTGKEYPFASNFTPRSFNGIIYYSQQNPPVSGPCPNNNVNSGLGQLTPPCGSFASTGLIGGGTYVDFDILQGASYSFSTCNGNLSDTKLTGYQGNTTNQVFFFDDNGPFCSPSAKASGNWIASFTGVLRVNIDEPTCTYSLTSTLLQYRQNNNVTLNSSSTQDICAGATRSLSGSPVGGTFTVSAGGGSISGNTYTASNSPGTYTITYTFGQCSDSDDIEVLPTPTDPVSITANPNTTICPGTTVDLTVNGGTLGSGGEWVWYIGNSCGGSVFQNSGSSRTISVTPSSTTTYSVRAEGDCGNSSCVSRTVNVNVLSSAPTNANANPSTVCPGDPTTLSVSGGSLGTGGSYEWYVGGCGSGTSIASGSTVTVNPTSPTTYYVRAEDNCGNTSCASVSVGIKDESTAPTGINFTNNNFCPGTTTTLSVLGGSLGTGAQWVWYDGNACCTNQIGTGSSISVAPNSTTTYYVRAEGDCNTTSHASTTITVLDESTAPTSISEDNNPVCGVQSNSVTMTVNGGSLGSGANWEWYSGSCGGTSVGSGSSITVNNISTTTTYYVRAEGTCNNTSCVFVVIEVSDGITIDSTSVTHPSCNGFSNGSASVFISGGITPYLYTWSHTSSNSPTVSGMSSGTYNVTVSDDAGCLVTQSFNLVDPPLLSITNVSTTDILCNGDSTGQIGVTATGGTPPLRYSVDGGANYQSSGTFTGLPAGSYNVEVLDTNNCLTVFSGNPVVLNEPPAIVLTIDSFNDASCSGSNDGEIFSSATGGTPPYDFSLNNGPFRPTGYFASLSSGNYTVLVRDDNGCTETASVFIDNETALTVYEDTSTDASCFGVCDGSATFSTVNGTQPINYTINNITFQTNPTFNNLCAGTYTILAVDALGCSNDTTFTIGEPDEIIIDVSNVVNVGCNGDSTGEINISVSGGTPAPGSGSGSSVSANDSLSYTGNTTGGPTWQRTFSPGNGTSGSCSLSGVGSNVPYNVQDFTVSTTGSFDISSVQNYDGYIHLYENAFDPLDQCLNLIALDDDGTGGIGTSDIQNITLNSGTTYYLVTSGFNNTHEGDYTNTILGNGVITLSDSSSAGAYTYNWSNGETTQNIDSLSAGTYTVTVTDENGCTATTSVTLTEAPQLYLSLADIDSIDCNGVANGRIDITVGGGTLPYSYAWSNGETKEDISGLAPGNYTVTVTDANGCVLIDSWTVTEPPAIAISGTVTDADCNGGTTGSIDLSVNGGTPPYSYSWSNGETTADIDSLSGGTYIVTVTDAKGCLKNQSFQVNDPSFFDVFEFITDVSCYGGNDGSIAVDAFSPSGFNEFVWSTGFTDTNFVSSSISGLTAGTYTVSITDINDGCSTFQTYVVDQPDSIVLTANVGTQSCAGTNNSSINLSVNGGTTPYSYLWNTGDTTQDLSGLTSGTYDVTVTDDNGCTAMASYNIGQVDSMQLLADVENITCNGKSDGRIFVTVLNGQPPYQYTWSNGKNTSDITGLSVGTYSLTVTDALGCVVADTFAVSEPPVLSASVSGNDAACNGQASGNVNLSVSGGTAPYSYQWSNFDTTQNLTNVPAGTYSVVVSDDNNCTITTSFTVGQPTVLTVTDSIVNVSCSGGSDGAIFLTVNGGTPPISFNWSNGATTQNINNLTAGTYDVTVTDNNSCADTLSYTVTEPAALTASSVVTDVTCNGGSDGAIDVTVSGGTMPYAYSWDNGDTTQDISGEVAGIYELTISDANGCTHILTDTIEEPNMIVVTDSITHVSCNGGFDGAIDISVTGGVAPYSYVWSVGLVSQDISGLSAGTYTVIVTDNNGCQANESYVVGQPQALSASFAGNDAFCFGDSTGNIDLTVNGGTPPFSYLWSTGDTTEDLNNVPAGLYTVEIEDSNGCSLVASYAINQPPALEVSGTVTNATCYGSADGAVDITVTGGTPSYSFNWSNGEITEDISNLIAGIYDVTVTDANGCTEIASFVVGQPDSFDISAQIIDVDCYGASTGGIDISVSGSNPPYSYDWNTSAGDTTQDVFGLSAGTYTLILSDVNGCSDTSSYTVNEPDSLDTELTAVNLACNGTPTGSVDLTVSGGTPPYRYSWSSGQTTQDLNNISAGFYSVTVTDFNGCTKFDSITVTQPDELNASANVTTVLCNGDSTGAIDLTPLGGTPPYSFNWSNSEVTEDISGLASGLYTVTITDDSSCTRILTYNVSEPAPLGYDLVEQRNVLCYGQNGGSIVLAATGGVQPYSFYWSNGDTTNINDRLIAGDYYLTLTDANSCEFIDTFTVTQPDSIATSSVIVNATCNGGFDGAIDLTVTGGVEPYSYFWNDFVFSEDRSGLNAGRYVVIVEDSNGCRAIDSFMVGQPNPINIEVFIKGAGCGAATGGIIDLTVSGGTPTSNNPPYDYYYLWSTGDTTEDLTNLAAGSYTVTVADSNGCEETRTVVIPSFPEPDVEFTANNACFGQSIQFVNNSEISSGSMDFYWDYGNGDVDSLIENPVYTYPDSGTYDVVLTALSNQGCVKSDTQTVTVYPVPDATIQGTGGDPCVIDSVQLSVVGGATLYAWSTGDSSTSTTVYESGVYGVSVVNGFGCLSVDTVSVFISEVNNVTISEDTIVNFGFGAQLFAIGGEEYLWTPEATIDDPFSATPIVTPDVSTTYSVVVTDENGCTFRDSVHVEVDDEILLIIPNIITPNGDGFNDTWKIKNILNYDICEVNIYNRWGNEVFSQRGYNNDWDGGNLSDGTYYYVIQCDDSDVLYKGAVTILR